MMKNMKFKTKIIIGAILITFIPLIISYWIFVQDKLEFIDRRIKENIRATGVSVSQTPMVQDKLYHKINDGTLQYYTQGLIQSFEDVDIIVIADMDGVKYSHLDTAQIGEKFIGEDKEKVLTQGIGYYSLKEGSMGVTLRRFEPIFKGREQVGFVMVGKYYNQINLITYQTKAKYMVLFIISLTASGLFATYFALSIKKAILNMEPLEIATLYKQKESLFNSVQESIIGLDDQHQIQEINQNGKELIKDLTEEALLNKIYPYLEQRSSISLQEFIIKDKKLFISIQPIVQKQIYLGTVITIRQEKEIRRVAEEITGIQEMNKNLRATVHEFKNNLHVILGLLQLEAYTEAKKYILEIQDIKTEQMIQFSQIEDEYIRALLVSRAIMAKEKQVEFVLTEESHLRHIHGYIHSTDLITIIGNLIENALEAASICDKLDKKVIVTLYEDEDYVFIKVRDNGVPIPGAFIEKIFEMGESSKGKGRGNGLYLVKNRLAIYNGKVRIDELGEEKLFTVIIPKEQERE